MKGKVKAAHILILIKERIRTFMLLLYTRVGNHIWGVKLQMEI